VRDGHEEERDKHGVSLLGSNRFEALAFSSSEQNKLSLHLPITRDPLLIVGKDLVGRLVA